MEELKDIFTYVDEHWEEMYEDLCSYCAFPSVEGNTKGLEETKVFVHERMKKAGLKVKELEVPYGNNLIYGEMPGEKNKTLMFYNHYDVVEPGKVEYWKNKEPFKVYEEEGMLYARGISDDKGPLLTRLHALEAIKKVRGKLPIGVKFLVEGDEESSSPSLFSYVEKNKEEFKELTKADALLWENGRIDENGHPWVRFGVRGNCSFDLKVTTANKDLHGRMGSTVPSASWRMVWALASLKDAQEHITIEGFYDDVLPPSKEELEVLKAFPYDDAKVKKGLELNNFLLNTSGYELRKRMYLEPTLSICGLEAGELYNGPRGIVPHVAFARISFYLVAAQEPTQIEKLLRAHLDKNGFSDVEIVAKGYSTPVKTRLDIPFKDEVVKAAEKVYANSVVIEPTQLGAGPAIVFRDAWPELPIVGIGPGNTGSNHHAPNENLRVEDYKNAVKHIIALMYEMA